MSQYYVGVKQVFAWHEEKAGQPGYHVVYDKGTASEYHSWSPADKFDAAYLPLGEENDGSTITEGVVRSFIAEQHQHTLGKKTTVVHGVLANGFEVVESSSCVDPKNYSEDLGAEICRDRVRSLTWKLLGFVLQWARDGIKK